MQAFFRRWLDSFVALPERLRLPLAVLGATLFHGLLLVGIWVWPYVLAALLSISLLPPSCAPQQPMAVQPPPKPKPLEIVIEVPPPKAEPEQQKLTVVEEKKLMAMFVELPMEAQREYIDVEGLAKKKNLSKRALLESWQDSVLGSRKPGSGKEADLPSQDGRDDLAFTSFKNQRAVVGDPKKLPSPEETPVKKPPVASSDVAPLFKPLPTTNATPDPKNPEKIAETAQITPPAPEPEPEPEPAPAAPVKPPPPPNLKRVVEAQEDEIPMFVQGPDVATKVPEPEPVRKPEVKPEPPKVALAPKPTPVPLVEPKPPAPRLTPPPIAPPPPKVAVKPPATPPPRTDNMIVASKTPQTMRPAPLPDPGYTPHHEKRKVDGASTPGEDGVDAVATSRGRYVKSVNQLVGSRWIYYVKDARQGSLITVGTVAVKFKVDAKGKILALQIVENTSNSAHAILCETVFRESQSDMEPPPPELLRDGVFEDTIRFHLY